MFDDRVSRMDLKGLATPNSEDGSTVWRRAEERSVEEEGGRGVSKSCISLCRRVMFCASSRLMACALSLRRVMVRRKVLRQAQGSGVASKSQVGRCELLTSRRTSSPTCSPSTWRGEIPPIQVAALS